MNTQKPIITPTGKIAIIQGEKGLLEVVSIGDYGKDKNIKADFLGYSEEINGVPHGDIEPLSEKWVMTICTQYGCSMNCTFCDAPAVGKGKNVSMRDIYRQLVAATNAHISECNHTKRLNVHFARMGEPTWNLNVLNFNKVYANNLFNSLGLSADIIHPVVSTMLPKRNRNLIKFLVNWCELKNENYKGEAGLQFSINTTDDRLRREMFSGNSLNLEEISSLSKYLPYPVGRKYTLNFALADNYTVDAKYLRKLFDPKEFIVKITPIHNNFACENNNIKTTEGYHAYNSYRLVEDQLKNEGFDVLVFIPSKEEDESKITCGNVILSQRG